jgi:hypothetical protein
VTWPELLDDMEERLAAHGRALDAGALAPEPLYVTPDDGPLPAELRARAEQVLAATRALEAEVEHRRDAVLWALRRTAASETRTPAAYIDAHA